VLSVLAALVLLAVAAALVTGAGGLLTRSVCALSRIDLEGTTRSARTLGESGRRIADEIARRDPDQRGRGGDLADHR
jgi:hypothetical protein